MTSMRFACITALALAGCFSPAAFAQCAQGCPEPKLIPITGHVFDADTGKPIPNAEVHYFESNPPEDMHANPLHAPHEGVVRTSPDGSYALPADLPLSNIHVRASAPGYLAASYTDEPGVVGHPWPAGFPPRPSHDLRLQPNHGMLAFGSSQLGAAYPHAMSLGVITAGAFAPDRSSFLFALPGPTLWLISLPDGKPHAIPVPKAPSGATLAISAIGWDGHQLLFLAEEAGQEHRSLGAAAAPDFNITLVPTPSIFSIGITLGPPTFLPSRFRVEQTVACEAGDTPHCGQSASLEVHDDQKNRTIPIKSASVADLSYLLDPLTGTILFSDPAPTPLTPSTRQQFPPPLGQRLAALDLATASRAYLDLPGDGSVPLNLIAERVVPGKGRLGGFLVAYTTGGDCDPRSTDAAQPFAPAGAAGTTPNGWSLCIVTVPAPSSPAAPRHTANPAPKGK